MRENRRKNEGKEEKKRGNTCEKEGKWKSNGKEKEKNGKGEGKIATRGKTKEK